MTGGMDKHWIIPRVGDKELPRVDQMASCSLLNSYVLNDPRLSRVQCSVLALVRVLCLHSLAVSLPPTKTYCNRSRKQEVHD